MRNVNHESSDTDTASELAIFVTTEEASSPFVVEMRFAGVEGFVETSKGSGLFSRSEVATRGSFTVIRLLGIAVQNKLNRNKGIHVSATNPNHELTVYALNDERESTDGYSAISCTSYPTTRDYRYFVFSAGFTGKNFITRFSQFLIVPCEDDTRISIHGSTAIESPLDMFPSVSITDPKSSNSEQRVVTYGRLLNQFETLMIDSPTDLTGTIVITNRPISVFTGHQCGQVPTGENCDYLVEQIPPHATYGTLFFTAPFAERESGDVYRIGSVRNGVTGNFTCSPEGSSFSTTSNFSIDEGGYHQIITNSGSKREFCCIQTNLPVTVMGYTQAYTLDFVTIEGKPAPYGDSAMVYIPPATAYLNNYTITTATELIRTTFFGYISYVLPTHIFNNSKADQDKFRVNEVSITPDSGYQSIYCSVNGKNEICAYGAYHEVSQGESIIVYGTGIEAFGLYTYGFTGQKSYAYTVAFEMEPVGRKLYSYADWVSGYQYSYCCHLVQKNIFLINISHLIKSSTNYFSRITQSKVAS